MPSRLIEIFDLSKTPGEDRQKQIALCCYQDDALREAECFEICPGSKPISPDEQLARAMERPSHVMANALAYTTGAFQEASKRGLSVQQLSLTTSENVHAFGRAKAALKGREYLGYVAGVCEFLREATSPTSGKRLFGIFSTPEDDTPSHADIFIIISPSNEEKAAIKYFFHDAFDLSRLVSPV